MPDCIISGGDYWNGIILDGGQCNIANTWIYESKKTFVVKNNSTLNAYNVNIDEYFDEAILIDGTNSCSLEQILLRYNMNAPVDQVKHINIIDNTETTMMSTVNINGNGTFTDIGVNALNSSIVFDQLSLVSSCKTGINHIGGTSLKMEYARFLNNEEYGVNSNNTKSSSVEHCIFRNNANVVGDDYAGLTISNCEEPNIRNNAFENNQKAVKLTGGSTFNNPMVNNYFINATSSGVTTDGDYGELVFLCNDHIGQSFIDVGVNAELEIMQGATVNGELVGTGVKFSQNSTGQDMVASSASMVVQYNYTKDANREKPNASGGMELNDKLIGLSCNIGPANYVLEDGNFDLDRIATLSPADKFIGTPSDIDGDGDPDITDPDDDNDGIPDVVDNDDDGDGVNDVNDPDWCPQGFFCDPPEQDPTLVEWDQILEDYNEEILTENFNESLLLDGGDGLLVNFINQNSSNNSTLVLNTLISVSPYVSIPSISALINNSIYFNEQDIVNVIINNPDVLFDSYINSMAFNSNFSPSNEYLMMNAMNVETPRSAFRINVHGLNMKRDFLKAKYNNRLILFKNGSNNINSIDVIEHKLDLLEIIEFKKELETSIIKIRPNPVSNYVIVEGILDELYVLKMYDISGKLILNSTLSQNENIVNLTKVDNGVCLLSIFNDKKELIYNDKLILQK